MKKTLAFLCSLLFVPLLFAQTVFSGLDINAENRLLFTASYTNLLQRTESALFSTAVQGAKPAILTCAPEKMELLDGGSVLQIRNWYGTARYRVNAASLSWTSQTPFFIDGAVVSKMTLDPVAVSPDGLWIVSFRKTGAAYGELVLTDVKKNAAVVIAANLPLNLDEAPVRWSPDSSLFVYEKNNGLYFAKPSQFFAVQPLGDKYRRLGNGTIHSVYWASPALLMYLNDGNVFAVASSELQIRALYADFVPVGKLAGTLPDKFDSRSDRFWTSRDGSALVLVQNNRTVTYIALGGTDFQSASKTLVQPFAAFRENVLSVRAFWPDAADPVLWVESFYEGRVERHAFRFSAKGLSPLDLPRGAREPLFSPDRTRIAVNSDAGLHVYDAALWKPAAVFTAESVRCFVWGRDSILFVGGEQTVRRWDASAADSRVLFLSRADTYGWNPAGQKIIAAAAGSLYEYVSEKNTWQPTDETMRPAQIQNARLRVFLDEDRSGNFTNSIYVRSILGVSDTRDIFAENARPKVRSALLTGKIALSFDALDNADGLAAILKILQDYSIKATFFINGEFIQRYPQAVREIANAGHQCGSMFYTNFDFADPQFVADADFILKGLARTEEEFFAVTGRDLSPVWHTPNYMINSSVRDIAARAGYAYVDRGFAPLDWVSLETGINTPGLYVPSAAIIESLAKSFKTGSVLPVSTGLPSGVRFDYLYDKLDVLIQAVLAAGYRIVTVSDL